MDFALSSLVPLALFRKMGGSEVTHPTKRPPVGPGGTFDLGFKPHAAIEKWAKYKEDFHLRFRWTPRRAFDAVFWGLVIPFAAYKMVTNEQQRVDKQNGRKGEYL